MCPARGANLRLWLVDPSQAYGTGPYHRAASRRAKTIRTASFLPKNCPYLKMRGAGFRPGGQVMTDNVHRVASRYASRQGYEPEFYSRSFDYAPGERAGPLRKRPRRGVLRRLIFLCAVLGLGWVVYDDPKRVGRWWSTVSDEIAPIVARALAPSTKPAPADVAADPEPPGKIAIAATTPVPFASLPYTPVVTSGPEQAPENGEANSDPPKPEAPKIIAALPPVRAAVKPPAAVRKPVPKRDRLAVRALSAGLHPKLSRVLLSRLSKTDFRNASYAVRTALANTAAGATFKWPRRRKAGLAMFEVRFVPGAARGCRRYVVTIEKDRWLTTALPIEKCGVKRRKTGRAAKS
mgnify:FL=1